MSLSHCVVFSYSVISVVFVFLNMNMRLLIIVFFLCPAWHHHYDTITSSDVLVFVFMCNTERKKEVNRSCLISKVFKNDFLTLCEPLFHADHMLHEGQSGFYVNEHMCATE